MYQAEKNRELLFAGMVVLAHLIFYLLSLKFTRIYMGDSMEYIYEATNIRRFLFFYSGNPAMPIVPELMTQRQPLYPLFLGAVYLFSVNNWIVLVLQNVLSVFNIMYVRRLCIGLGYRDKFDWILMVLLIGYPAQFIHADTIAPDILLQTVVLLYFGQALNFLRKRQLRHAAFMSILLSAGMLVKPVCYPLVLPHVLFVAGVAYRYKLKMQRPVLVSVIPLCVLLLYSYWNYTRTEKFHFSSNQAFNAVYYYYPYVRYTQGQDSASGFLAAERRRMDVLPDFKDRYDAANEEGMRLLRDNWRGYLLFHLANSVRTLFDPGKAEIDLFTGKLTYGRLYRKGQVSFLDTVRKQGLSGFRRYISSNPTTFMVLFVLLLNIVKVAGLILFFRKREIDWPMRATLIFLIAYFLVAAGPIGNTRYFLPVSLLAAGAAAMAIGSLIGNGKEKRT